MSLFNSNSGLSVTSDSPTEVGFNASVRASLFGGNDSFVSYKFDCGDSDSTSTSSSPTTTCNYATAGHYMVRAQAFNPVSMIEASVQVRIMLSWKNSV